jgi:hypothetical protein
MFKDLIILILFSILINWITSLQTLNQSTQDKNVKIVSISMAIFMGVVAGFILRLSL